MRHRRATASAIREPRALTRGAAIGAALLVTLGVAACVPTPPQPTPTDAAPSDSDPADTEPADDALDVTPQGQLEFACVLSQHAGTAYGSPSDWEIVGEDADPGAVAAAAIASLVGSVAGYELPDHPALSEAGDDVLQGITAIDPGIMLTGLQDVSQACVGVGPIAVSAVSQDDQIAYACALADFVVDERGAVESWGSIGEERAWHEAASVASLLGAMNGAVVPGSESMTDGAIDIIRGVSSLDVDGVQSGLDAVVAACDA